MKGLEPVRLTDAQKKQFSEKGYLHLPGRIPAAWLHEMRDALQRICTQRPDADNLAVIGGSEGKEYVINANKIIGFGEPVFVQLLGSPLLLSLAEAICGEDFFPVQDFAVIKNLGDNSEVMWHQDVLTNVPGKSFMIGFYLDPADDANGALRVVPGSHRSGKNICELQKMPYDVLQAGAGDLLMHDLMTAHSSGLMSSQQQRRVVYFEFMGTACVREHALYSEEFIALRTSLIPAAQAVYAEKFPGAETFGWKNPEREKYPAPENPMQHIRQVCSSNLRVKAAAYCFDFGNLQAVAPGNMS